MKIALYSKNINPDFLTTFQKLTELLLNNNIELICEEGLSLSLRDKFDYTPPFSSLFSSTAPPDKTTDILLSIGGDGTFLDSIEYIVGKDIPVLGINTGRLGFLANVSPEQIDELVKRIISKSYNIVQRDLLSLQANGKLLTSFNYSLNEVGILKSETSSLLTLEVYINNEFLTTYWADGLVVATPTGSTAYSLSGGGPIVAPNCDVLILTPICPHNLSVRPLVVPKTSQINIKIKSRTQDYVLSMDSRTQRLSDNYELSIHSHKHKLNIIEFPEYSYYRTLRNKLLWGKDTRSKP